MRSFWCTEKKKFMEIYQCSYSDSYYFNYVHKAHSPDAPGISKNASGTVSIPLKKGCLWLQAINLVSPKKVKAWGGRFTEARGMPVSAQARHSQKCFGPHRHSPKKINLSPPKRVKARGNGSLRLEACPEEGHTRSDPYRCALSTGLVQLGNSVTTNSVYLFVATRQDLTQGQKPEGRLKWG